MLPDEFDIKVGPNDEKAPVPVSVHVSVDDKVLGLAGFMTLALLIYGIKRAKK